MRWKVFLNLQRPIIVFFGQERVFIGPRPPKIHETFVSKTLVRYSTALISIYCTYIIRHSLWVICLVRKLSPDDKNNEIRHLIEKLKKGRKKNHIISYWQIMDHMFTLHVLCSIIHLHAPHNKIFKFNAKSGNKPHHCRIVRNCQPQSMQRGYTSWAAFKARIASLPQNHFHRLQSLASQEWIKW